MRAVAGAWSVLQHFGMGVIYQLANGWAFYAFSQMTVAILLLGALSICLLRDRADKIERTWVHWAGAAIWSAMTSLSMALTLWWVLTTE